MHRKRLAVVATMALAVILAVVGSVHADSITIDPVKLKIGGVSTDIGKITATTTKGTEDNVVMEGLFTTNAAVLPLLDCFKFHWFQVVTALTASDTNPKFDGDALKPPIVDPVYGGYKSTKGGKATDDFLPWYWNAEEEKTENTTAGQTKKYHISDAPTVVGAKFDTWLIVELGDKKFSVIAGYEWATGDKGDITSLKKKNGDGLPTAGDMTTIATALANSGFGDWTAEKDSDLTPCPEPSTIALLAAGSGLLWIRRRRMRMAA